MDDVRAGEESGASAAARGATADAGGRGARLVGLRGHHWAPIERAAVIAALAIVMGSLFVTTHTLALGDPVPRRIDAALVGDPRADSGTVKAVQGSPRTALTSRDTKRRPPRSVRSIASASTRPST
jgi:hypothetical protein